MNIPTPAVTKRKCFRPRCLLPNVIPSGHTIRFPVICGLYDFDEWQLYDLLSPKSFSFIFKKARRLLPKAIVDIYWEFYLTHDSAGSKR